MIQYIFSMIKIKENFIIFQMKYYLLAQYVWWGDSDNLYIISNKLREEDHYNYWCCTEKSYFKNVKWN